MSTMSDYTSEGAVPVEDAAVPNPPTVNELLDEKARENPEQFEPGTKRMLSPDAAVEGDNGGA